MSLNKQMAKIIAETAIFMEFSEEDVIDPDTSVSFMEQISAILKELELSDRVELNDLLAEVSEDYSDDEHKQFIKDLGINFGFLDESVE